MTLRFLKTTLLIVSLLSVWSFAGQPLSSIVRLQSHPLESAPQSASTSMIFDLQHIPIGDGKISTRPTVGSVWSCRTRLGGDGIGGAQTSGAWIHADGTYDLTAKPTVDGSVHWLSKFSIQLKKDMRVIVGNRLPKDPTGKFPISPNDDAYAYDRNPNSIAPAAYQVNLPALPQVAEMPSCLPLGEIGVLANGGYFFNALDAGRKDAVAHEIQDRCQGHPEVTGAYHYHSVTTCLEPQHQGKSHSGLVGYALDGFGIYGHRGENGQELTNADLDVCHGHIHEIEWDRTRVNLYHYHATWEYPYTIGCYRGKPTQFRMKPRI
jgi:YHYH protein